MGKRPENEMEQIQKGLERFLDREVGRAQTDGASRSDGYEGDGRNYDGDHGDDGYDTIRRDGPHGEGDPEDERYHREDPEDEGYYGEGDPEDEGYHGEERPWKDRYDRWGEARVDMYDRRMGPSLDDEYDEREETAYDGRGRRERYLQDAEYDREEKRDKPHGKKNGEDFREDGAGYGRREGGMRKEKGKKKRSGWKKLFFFLAFLAAVFLGGLYLLVGAVYGKMRYEEAPGLAGKSVKNNGVTSVLLIGSDSRDSSAEGRSDAMILLSISNRTRTVHMTSLLRDMYVEIPGHEGNRLNAAYAFGGPELLLTTIQANFGIEVNRYVVVNFEAFANLVDAVGGVDLELSSEEVQWVNAYLNEYNLLRDMPIDTDYLDTSLSGLIHLNGAQSLAYSRNRYIGTDFGRTERQRKVLSEVLKRLPVAAVKNPRQLAEGLFPNLTTNLTQMECLRISLQAGKLLTYEIVQDSIPLTGTYSNADIRGMAVLQVDLDKNREYLRKEIYGEE